MKCKSRSVTKRSGRLTTRLLFIAWLAASLPLSAHAQRAEAIRIGLKVDRNSPATSSTRTPSDRIGQDTALSRGARTGRGAVIGAVVGATVGTLVAFIEANKATVQDHSEDAYAFLAFFTLGALVGLVAGAVVGFFWK